MELKLENAIQVLLIGASFGVCLFILAHLWLKERITSARYLGIFYGANIVNILDEWFWHFDIWQIAPWLTNLYLPFLYLLAPSFYLYVKGLTDPSHNNQFWANKKHFFGFVAGGLFCVPYLVLDSETKIARLSAPPGTLEHLGLATWGPTIALLLLMPFSLCYVFGVTKLLTHHLNTIKSYFSNIDNRDLSWIRWSIIALFIAFAVSTVRIFLPERLSEEGWQNSLFLTFELLWLLIVGVLSVTQGPIYKSKNESVRVLNCADTDKSKYHNSPMQQVEIERLTKRLNDAMADGMYNDPNLTLRKLSDYTGIAEIRISQVLNTAMNVGFYDFINSWRIQAACKMMAQTEYTILEIAFEVGFNSRSTFNQAFKKQVGVTPSAYRKALTLKVNPSRN